MMMRELHEVATGVSVEEAERQNYLQTVQELHQFEYKRLLRMHTRLFMTTFTQRSMKSGQAMVWPAWPAPTALSR